MSRKDAAENLTKKIRVQRISCSYISGYRDNNLDWYLTSKTTLDPARESFESAKAFFVVSLWKRSVLSAALLGVRVPTSGEIERRKPKLFPCYTAIEK